MLGVDRQRVDGVVAQPAVAHAPMQAVILGLVDAVDVAGGSRTPPPAASAVVAWPCTPYPGRPETVDSAARVRCTIRPPAWETGRDADSRTPASTARRRPHP